MDMGALFCETAGAINAKKEFAKLLGAEAIFGYVITLSVIKIVKFNEKMMNHP